MANYAWRDEQLHRAVAQRQRNELATPIGTQVQALLKTVSPLPTGIDAQAVLARVRHALPELLQQRVRLGPLRRGELTLLCDDATCRFEVQRRLPTILLEVQHVAGAKRVRTLRLAIA